MALFPRQYLNALVSVEVDKNGTKIPVASAFLFGAKLNLLDSEGQQRYFPFIITNRHVFEKTDNEGKFTGEYVNKIYFRFNAEEKTKYYPQDLINNSGQPIWLKHDDPNVDLAVLPISGAVFVTDRLEYFLFTDDKFIFRVSEFDEAGIDAGNGVFVLGFPRGIRGEDKNRVITRQGIISRVDSETIQKHYYYIDATAFPGNSGGPVISKPELISIEGTRSTSQSKLIGVVSSGETYADVAVSQQTGKPKIVFEENMDLIKIVPVDSILEIIRPYLDKQIAKQGVEK